MYKTMYSNITDVNIIIKSMKFKLDLTEQEQELCDYLIIGKSKPFEYFTAEEITKKGNSVQLTKNLLEQLVKKKIIKKKVKVKL